MASPLTAIIIMVQPLVGAMICILRAMREEIPTLTLVVTRTAVLIVTIISGLDHDTGIISAQMSWRFIMKCLLETGNIRQRKHKKQTNKQQQQQSQQKHQQTNKNKSQQKINK